MKRRGLEHKMRPIVLQAFVRDNLNSESLDEEEELEPGLKPSRDSKRKFTSVRRATSNMNRLGCENLFPT
jgi:hypothetical protein